MNKEDQIKEKAEEMLSKISNTGFGLRAEKEATESKLEGLKRQLSEALVDCALGEIPVKEVLKIKSQIRPVEDFLKDYPLIDEGLDRKATQQTAILRKAITLQEYRRKYDNLKAELKDEDNPSSLESLQNLAMELNEKEDSSRFLSKLGKAKV